MHRSSLFTRFANRVAIESGRPLVFALALGTIIGWAFSGLIFGFSDTWQLVINTATTIVTFLMVFLIQNSQNRDAATIQLKLDELIRSTVNAEDALLDLEEIDDHDLADLRHRYEELANQAREHSEDVHGNEASEVGSA